MNRLEKLKQYLTEAMKDEANNELYIEDLKLSIEYEKSLIALKIIEWLSR